MSDKKEEFDVKTMRANFSAILYLMTEQQALIGRLVQTLFESGIVNFQQLDKITDIKGGEEGLVPTYTELYQRFATYYLRIKVLLDEGTVLDDVIDEAFKDQDKKDKDNE